MGIQLQVSNPLFFVIVIVIIIIITTIIRLFLSYLYYLFIRLALTSTQEEHPIWLQQATGRNTGQGSCIMLQTFLLHTLYYT